MDERELKLFFRSLSDENRLKIVRMLMDHPKLRVCDFMRLLKLSQPHVSFHIKVLRKANVISCRRVGKWAYCSLNRENPLLNALIDFIKVVNLDQEKIGFCETDLEVKP